MSGKLEKMKILCFQDDKYTIGPVNAFIANFNPDKYSQEQLVEYARKESPNGSNSSSHSFVKKKSREMSFTFLFDGTGVHGEVLPVPVQLEHFMLATSRIVGKMHRPYYLILNWGTLVFKCVLESAKTTYTLFTPAGIPLRATVEAKFIENIEDNMGILEAALQSPDLTHEVIVAAGDTLPLLCHRIYGDPSYYPDVARINKIRNPRQLTQGQKIIFPPIINAQNA